MKKVLVIGGAGFIGLYIVRELLKRNYDITIIDNFSKYGPIKHDFFSHHRTKVLRKNVLNCKPEEFDGYDWVLCLAALIGGIKYFHQIPYQISRDNTAILMHVIDGILSRPKAATFVYFSSSMVFERMDRPAEEKDVTHQMVPMTNYGMQKLFGEYLVRGAHEEFQLPYSILRPFNAVGSGELPKQKEDGSIDFGMAHVLPDFVAKALMRQSPFEIMGDGEQIRTFTHARDIANAVGQMMDKNILNEDFNICGNTTLKMADLATTIWSKVNPDIQFPGFKNISAPPSDVRFRVGLAKKAQNLLQWKPELNLNFIIDDVLNFIRKSNVLTKK